MDLPLILAATLLLMLAVGVLDLRRPLRWICRRLAWLCRAELRRQRDDARRRERAGRETVKVGVQP